MCGLSRCQGRLSPPLFCVELCSQFRIFSLLSSESLGWVRVVVVCPAESVRPPLWPAQVQTRARVTPGHQLASSSSHVSWRDWTRTLSPWGNFQKFLKGLVPHIGIQQVVHRIEAVSKEWIQLPGLQCCDWFAQMHNTAPQIDTCVIFTHSHILFFYLFDILNKLFAVCDWHEW